MKEEILERILANQYTHAAIRVLFQSCIATDTEPYVSKCRGVSCGECPFYVNKRLCYTRLTNEEWKDIAMVALNYES